MAKKSEALTLNSKKAEWMDVLMTRDYIDRDGNERTNYTKIGVAFPFREREGFSIELEALPAPVEGHYKVIMMPRQK